MFENYTVFVIKAHDGKVEAGSSWYYRELVELQVLATTESQAITKAKKYIKRNEYIVTGVIENFRESRHVK